MRNVLPFLLLGLLFGCASGDGSGDGWSPLADRVAPDAIPDGAAPDGVVTDLPDDLLGEVDVPPDIPAEPSCPVILSKGLSYEYGGAEKDEIVYAENGVFHGLVDQVLLDASTSEPPIEMSREDYPVYDFKWEDAPKGRLKWEYDIRHNHFGLVDYMQGFQGFCADHPQDPVEQLAFLSDKIDNYVEPESVLPFIEQAAELAQLPGALPCALAAIHGMEPVDGPWDESALEQIPDDLRAPFASYLYSLHFALEFRRLAFAEAVVPFDDALYSKATSKNFGSYSEPDGLEAVGDLTDFRSLTRGGQILAAATMKLAGVAGFEQIAEPIRLETPYGAILLAGPEDDKHHGTQGPYLLIVDGGGDDHYYGTIAASQPGYPCSVVVDVGGNDIYETTLSDPTLAAGYLGYGMLWDVAGDDEYHGRYDSVASATLGIGILYDGAGNDFYDSIGNSQASAALGLALLVDGSGDDHYYAFRASQAYAAYRSAALLLDVDGNDLFEAEDDIVLYPAAQNPNFNGNMCQGAGQGFRNDNAEFTDNYCGGIATLVDLAGDDIYTGAIFAQGVGYWFGAGFLIDAEGSDSYSGVWYNFGAAAHFAGGGHLDSGGEDDYFCLQDQCMGEGRDYSIGVMANLGGDDTYHAQGGRNIGAGDLFGAGIFWDDEGDDTYQLDQQWGIGYAFAEKFAEYSFTFGLFLDSGGTEDDYVTPAEHPANDKLWTQLGNHNDGESTIIKAIGLDQ
jgi:hypothetical protein